MMLHLWEASPAWTIEDDCLIGMDLAFTQGVRLSGLDVTCEADEGLEDLSRRLNDVLCAVPEDSVVRLYSVELSGYDGLLASYQGQFKPDSIGGYVARKKAEQCKSSLQPRHRELYVFVSTPPALRSSHFNSALLGKRAGRLLRKARSLHVERLQLVQRLLSSVQRALAGAGLAATKLDGAELFGIVWRLANPVLSATVAPPAYRPELVLRSQLFASGLMNHYDFYEREGCLNRVVSLKTPPKQVLPTELAELQTLPFRHQLVVTLRRVGDQDAYRRVETNRRQGRELNKLLSKMRGAERHVEMPDHGLAQQQQDVNDVLARLTRGEKLYDVSIQVWFAGKTPDDLQRQTEATLAKLRVCGHAEGAVEELRGRFAFASMLPGHHCLMGDRYHPFLASRAADLLPVVQTQSGAAKPTAILSTRSNELVGFHPFEADLPAWNATVAGTTGSGKSFTVRTLLNGWIASGGRVVIATRGKDYHRYAEIFGGKVNDISLEDEALALGPFPPPAEVASQATPAAVFEHLAAIIGIMVADGAKSLDRLGRRLIYAATQDLYSQLEPTAAAPTFQDWVTALERVAHKEPDSVDLASAITKQLKYWLEGPYGRAFCRNRAVGGDGKPGGTLSLWNLESITNADTQGVVMGVLSGVIARSIQEAPTVVVLDEVWSIFKSEAGATLVETLYRTVRKEGSAIWTISQSMNDYVALPDATRSAILNNSPIKLFLSHDPSELELVGQLFQLTDRERNLLKSLTSEPGHYSELLAFFGKRRQVLRVIPTGIEYWLATSHRKDRDWEKLAIEQYPELSRTEIVKRLGRSYPHGVVHIQLAA
jgi:hypothetical protein